MSTPEPGSPALLNPEEGITQPVSTVKVGIGYQIALFLGQFGLFVALMAPVYVSMQLKAQALVGDDAANVIGSVLPIGAFGALIMNPLAGALSDRTRTRWGRRRPWLLSGVVVFAIALAWIAYSPDVLNLTLAWLLAQLAANATLATLLASFADNVPQLQRGRSSSIIALAQNIAVLAGTYLSVFFVANLPVLFIAPGILAIILVAVYAVVARDDLPTYTLKKFTFLNLVASFWTNPVKNPDFAFAWWSRFLIILATFMFTTYRLLYMQEHIGIEKAKDATAAVAFGVLLYTIALLVSAALSGWASDKLGRRKVFVGGSTAMFAVGLVALAHADTVTGFYVAEIIMGFAYGIYSAIDTALVVDVLPNADRPGKDLGVINIANALPQSLAPAIALFFLKVGSDGAADNYELMCWAAGAIALIGALVVIPIKRVR
ncbi:MULTISPECIES: MFS transporter [Curtobacterium]|uniref:MFS transporter n=1 Tax=Curtobacterium TaxID=2034 RepID=UPI00217EF5A3|nr:MULTISPECIES: MFS transporter [Curtobacterium]MCS6561388.1 MFS transporter [Curtobacterium flaccumfaciens pv. poinsettiae]MDT0232553.1 MFS transporter [Curtobacterium sp. BRB10]UXN29270.1 MFS transporter [Curtobacterium flaccumfaciens]